MTPERLAELDAVMAKATEGPWFYGIAYHPEEGPVPLDYEAPGYYNNTAIMTAKETVAGCGEYDIFNTPEDAAAIIALHNAYPDLKAHIAALEAEVVRLREALAKSEDAMREMFRYYDGGETRGSYDGKPERAQLRTAWQIARAALNAKDAA